MKRENAITVPVYAVIREGSAVSRRRCVRLNARAVGAKKPEKFTEQDLTNRNPVL